MRLTPVIAIFIMSICALHSGAQTLNADYVALADSVDSHIAAGRWSDAERFIVEALRAQPAAKSNYILWSNLAAVRLNQDNFNGAVEACNIGLTTAPRSVVLLGHRASALAALHRNREAIADIDLALSVDSTLLSLRRMRGFLLAAEGEMKLARQDVEAALKADPADPFLIETLGDVEISEGNAKEAVKLYGEAYAIAPSAPLAEKRFAIARAYDFLPSLSTELREAVTKFPDSAMLHLLRAVLFKENYMTEEAQRELKEARRLGLRDARLDGIR